MLFQSFEVFRPVCIFNNQRRNTVTQAFPENDNASGASVSILEWVDAFIACMKLRQNFQCDGLRVIPGKKFTHCFRHFAGEHGFIHADDIRTLLVISNCVTVGAIFKDAAFQFIVELFDQFLAERLVNCF